MGGKQICHSLPFGFYMLLRVGFFRSLFTKMLQRSWLNVLLNNGDKSHNDSKLTEEFKSPPWNTNRITLFEAESIRTFSTVFSRKSKQQKNCCWRPWKFRNSRLFLFSTRFSLPWNKSISQRKFLSLRMLNYTLLFIVCKFIK